MHLIRKALITEFGDASKVVVVDASIAAPAAREAQIAVEYSALSGADINMRRGVYPFQPPAPLTPGYVVVGTVAALGARCEQVRVGQRVACMTVTGGQAERVNLAGQLLVPVPDGVDPRQAACLVLDWNTAWQMLALAQRRSDCRRIFVHGLSGAVGNALMRLALMRGIAVFGTASPRHHPALQEAGAYPLTYADKEWIASMTLTGGVDAVFDPLGFESHADSYAVLRRGGLLVAYGFNLPALTDSATRPVLPAVLKLYARNLRFWSGKRSTFYWISRDDTSFKPGLLSLFELAAAGRIEAAIKAVLPLEQIGLAHRAWGQGGPGDKVGSFVIAVGAQGAA